MMMYSDETAEKMSVSCIEKSFFHGERGARPRKAIETDMVTGWISSPPSLDFLGIELRICWRHTPALFCRYGDANGRWEGMCAESHVGDVLHTFGPEICEKRAPEY